MYQEIILIAFYILIFLFSVIIHEVMHGFVALKLGDNTAKYAGRLNFNPIKHVDLWGSIVVPLLMYLSFGFPFGWAKPVPYNPYNLRNQKWGPAFVALGGPLSNIFVAIISVFLAKMLSVATPVKIEIVRNLSDFSDLSPIIAGSFSSILFALLIMVVFWNVLLAFFNLIPFPPLDGSKILLTIFPIKAETMIVLENFGFIILLVFIFAFSGPLGSFLNFMLNLFFNLTL